MHVRFRYFRGSMSTWDELFSQASEFADTLDPALLINISHAVEGLDGTVAVWFWSEDEDEHEETDTGAAV